MAAGLRGYGSKKPLTHKRKRLSSASGVCSVERDTPLTYKELYVMTEQQESPKIEGLAERTAALEQRLHHVAQLADTAPTLDALVMADGVFTADERRMLLAFADLKSSLGRDTAPRTTDALTPREQMALAWHRQLSADDQQALTSAFIVVDYIDVLWKLKGGAA